MSKSSAEKLITEASGSLFTRALSVFLTTVEERKFSSAAKKLGVTQSSVSQTIALLEQKLGVSLFERDSRPLKPTPDALELYRAIKKKDEELRQLLATIQAKNWLKPDVRLGMIESAGQLIAGEVCKEMKATIGMVTLTAGTSGKLLDDLFNDYIDVAMVAGAEELIEVQKIKIYDDPWFLIFPPTSNLEPTSWIDLQLCGYPFIFHSLDTADGRILENFFQNLHLLFPKIYEVESNGFIYSLVSNGLGWSLTHLFGLLSSENSISSLKIQKAIDSLKPREVFLVAKKDYNPLRFQLIADIIQKAVASVMKEVLKHPDLKSLL